MHSAASFLDNFVKDEVSCRCLTDETFGQPLANEENDVPLYDMYNRGLVACESGLERKQLNLEGARLGTTGYIPSMEEGMEMGASPKSKTLVMELEEPDEKEMMLSAKRRGLLR
jgi:hypothetical protein